MWINHLCRAHGALVLLNTHRPEDDSADCVPTVVPLFSHVAVQARNRDKFRLETGHGTFQPIQ